MAAAKNNVAVSVIGSQFKPRATYLGILNFVLVHVLGTRGVLANILSLGELRVELFATVPAIGLGKTVLGRSFLDG